MTDLIGHTEYLFLFVTKRPTVEMSTLYSTPWSIKMCHFYFLNSFMKHWPMLIIFGTWQHVAYMMQLIVVLTTSL